MSSKTEWDTDDKDLLYFLCTEPTFKKYTWADKRTVFNTVCDSIGRPKRSLDSLTSEWRRCQAILSVDPKWSEQDSWEKMVGYVDSLLGPHSI